MSTTNHINFTRNWREIVSGFLKLGAMTFCWRFLA